MGVRVTQHESQDNMQLPLNLELDKLICTVAQAHLNNNDNHHKLAVVFEKSGHRKVFLRALELIPTRGVACIAVVKSHGLQLKLMEVAFFCLPLRVYHFPGECCVLVISYCQSCSLQPFLFRRQTQQ